MARQTHISKRVLITLFVLIFLGVIAGLEVTGQIHLFAKTKPTPHAASASASQNKGDTKSSDKPAGSPGQPEPSSNGGDKTIVGTSGSLLTPTGNFISSNQVSSNTVIASVCNTTPGATCQIVFTDGDQQESLPAEVTDTNGAAYWNWTPAKYSLGQGSWSVKAIATLKDQTKSADYSDKLEVQP
ncbi:MAG TPA: hypothetical protein VG604_01765 [Candidatus Saccharimonadales bacterium]|nr:hypothetical protein [Candidatus Saccharimonadales bacterium]